MGIIRNTYEEESDLQSNADECYNSNCVIMMESVHERLRPPPSHSGCGHRQPIYTCDNTSPPRSNSWPGEGGRRRGRRGGDLTCHPHHPCQHDCVHHLGVPAPDTGQRNSESAKVRSKDGCGRAWCPKCVPIGQWNRSKMLRLTGHCILLLILASCGGYILNSGIARDDSYSDLAEIVESPLLNNILQPIRVSGLKKQLKHTKNYYDFFRLFLTKKDVTNDVIDDIINARTIQKIQRDYDYEDYDEDMIMDADVEQERLDEELTQAMYHEEEMLNSPLRECKTPQPEIINVIDSENKNRLYIPECTVVYRCRNVSGCCGSGGYECGPRYVEAIERVFLVVDMFEDDKALPGKELVEKKIFINHTECECKEKKALPRCDLYKCPYPFTMMRKDGIACSCDCQPFANEVNYLCQSIKDGLVSLSERDLACIKAGDCLEPECTRGSLHIRSGLCPSVTEDNIDPGEMRYNREKNRHIRHFKERELLEPHLEKSVEVDREADRKVEINTDKPSTTEPNINNSTDTELLEKPKVESIRKPKVKFPERSEVAPVKQKVTSGKQEVATTVNPKVDVEAPGETMMESKLEPDLADVIVGNDNETEVSAKEETNFNMSRNVDVESDDEDVANGGEIGSGFQAEVDRNANIGESNVDTVKKDVKNRKLNRRHKKKHLHRRRLNKNKRKARKHRDDVTHKT